MARALASEAQVLVMDEPLSHLAPAHVPHYQTLITEHLQETGWFLHFCVASSRVGFPVGHAGDRIEPWIALVSRPAGRPLWSTGESAGGAELLGPVNWFSPLDYHVWFNEPVPARPQGVWPEQLEVEHVRESHLRVESCEFLGAYATWKLRHVARGELRVFRGCPPTLLPVGSCVRLRNPFYSSSTIAFVVDD